MSRFTPWSCRALLIAGCVLVLTGCLRIGPKLLPKTRFDYASAVGDSWKRQTLLNIVKIRYGQWPVFLEVETIVSSFAWEHTGVLKAEVKRPFDGSTDEGAPAYTGKFSERPQVLYQPLGGAEFVRSILTQPQPAVVLGLIYSGYPAEELLETMLYSVNGKKNLHMIRGLAYPAHGDFRLFVRAVDRLMRENAVVVSSRAGEEGDTTTALTFLTDDLSPEGRQRLEALRRRLDLDPATDTYRILKGRLAPDRETIALEIRSVLQLLDSLSWYVEIPPAHLAQGISDTVEFAGDQAEADLVPVPLRIRSGPRAPPDAFMKVPYLGQSFWIENTDIASKRTFSFLSLVLSVAESDQQSATQLTLSAN